MPEGKSHHIRATSHKHFIASVIYRQHLFVSICVFLSTKFDIKNHFILYKLIAFLGKNFSRKPSAGVPLAYYHDTNASISVENLTTNFLTTTFSSTLTKTYRKSGFLPYITLETVFTNKYTKISGDKLQVRSMKAEDIYVVTGLTEMQNNLTMNLADKKYKKLFILDNGCYYIALARGDYLWFLMSSGYVGNHGGVYAEEREQGIRPVVSLKSDVKASAKDIINAWNIEI